MLGPRGLLPTGIFAAAVFAASVASAVPRNFEISFSASAFGGQLGDSPSPVDSLTGAFTLMFDDSIFVLNETAGIALLSLSIPLDSALSYTYFPMSNELLVGGIETGAAGGSPGTNDFVLGILNLTTAPEFDYLELRQSGTSDGWVSETGSVTVRDLSAAVPLPPGLALILTGIAGLGLLRARRRG